MQKKKKVVIAGAGQTGRWAARMLNPAGAELVAFCDNDPDKQKHDIDGIPVQSPKQALQSSPDYVLAAVSDAERRQEIIDSVRQAGYRGRIMPLDEIRQLLDLRSWVFVQVMRQIAEEKVPGDLAELGVYLGDTAEVINRTMPGRRLYLFDTFHGFDRRDIYTELRGDFSEAKKGEFSDTSIQQVRERMPHLDKVIIRPGYFPQTAEGLEDNTYCFVHLDADLYEPTLAGLKYFYPRVSRGGVLFLHDYYSDQYRGVRKAVETYRSQCDRLVLIPVGDFHGSCMIVK